MTDCEYETESEYESESEDETEMFYQEISKFNYFKNCTVCNEVKSKQQILLSKCDTLHNVNCLISDYYCCDKCCKLKCLLDDYIYAFTRSYKYPEYSKACEILKRNIDSNEYTLELHCEMKQMYENLGSYDFYKWHKEKKERYKDTLCGYMDHYQRVHRFFLNIIYEIRNHYNSDYECLSETTRFICEMIVHNSV